MTRRFVYALRVALIEAGFTGEVDVRFANGEHSLTWIGKPNDRDMICAVTIIKDARAEGGKT